MLCPVCREEYSTEDIGNHVDLCFSLISAAAEESPPTPKRPFPYKEIDQTNPSKKHKPNPVTNMTHANQEKRISHKEHNSLAEKMRPTCLADYIGQEQVIGSNTVLQQLLEKGHIPSMIFWGPPGCGKVI